MPDLGWNGTGAVRSMLMVLALALFVAPATDEPRGFSPDKGGPPPVYREFVTFIVHVPNSTPRRDTIYLSGKVGELGNWNPAAVPLERLGEHARTITTRVPVRLPLEFKVTRGSWETVERGPAGEELDNRSWSFRGRDTLEITVAKWADQVPVPRRGSRSTRLGIAVLHRAFPSKFVRSRDVLVWLPPGYPRGSGEGYPVVYFNDGNDIVDDSTSIGGEWHLDEIATRLITQGKLRPFIAVAIYRTRDRVAEYTPVREGERGGRAGDYEKFLIEELKPFIDKSYRTIPGPQNTSLVGSSLGGLVALSIAFDRLDVFGNAAALSPSVFWADRWIVQRAATAPTNVRLCLEVSTRQGSTPSEAAAFVEASRELRDTLQRRGFMVVDQFIPGVNVLYYREVPDDRHTGPEWSARLERLLQFLLR